MADDYDTNNASTTEAEAATTSSMILGGGGNNNNDGGDDGGSGSSQTSDRGDKRKRETQAGRWSSQSIGRCIKNWLTICLETT